MAGNFIPLEAIVGLQRRRREAVRPSNPRTPPTAVHEVPAIRGMTIKIADSCNMGCSYCSYFLERDHGGRRLMSREILRRVIERVGDHVRAHEVPRFTFGWHGGEPLLAGMAFFQDIVAFQRELLPSTCASRNTVQTNLTLITQEWIDLFKELRFEIAFSLDGPKHVHDAHRPFINGRGTYDIIREKMALLEKNGVRSACMTVVHPEAEGAEVVDHLRGIGVRWNDLLPPLATRDRKTVKDHDDNLSTYLVRAFDAWLDADDAGFDVRFFKDAVRSILGGTAELCTYNKQCTPHITVEHDGRYGGCDSLRITGKTWYDYEMDVFTHALEDVHRDARYRYFHSEEQLSPKCRSCEYLELCGGGCPAWRYSSDTDDFGPDSIYCETMKTFLGHAYARVAEKCGTALPKRSHPVDEP